MRPPLRWGQDSSPFGAQQLPNVSARLHKDRAATIVEHDGVATQDFGGDAAPLCNEEDCRRIHHHRHRGWPPAACHFSSQRAGGGSMRARFCGQPFKTRPQEHAFGGCPVAPLHPLLEIEVKERSPYANMIYMY